MALCINQIIFFYLRNLLFYMLLIFKPFLFHTLNIQNITIIFLSPTIFTELILRISLSKQGFKFDLIFRLVLLRRSRAKMFRNKIMILAFQEEFILLLKWWRMWIFGSNIGGNTRHIAKAAHLFSII